MMISFFRIIKFAFQNFWRNFWLSIITISILVLTLFTINIFVTMNFLTQTAVSAVQSKIDVSVYFNPEASEDAVKNVRSYLLGLSQIKDVTYISADEAIAKFRAEHEDNAEIMASLEELEQNPLGATLVIKANNPDDYPFILETLNNPEFTSYIQDKNFDDHKTIIDRIDSITGKLQKSALVLSGLFMLIAILIVMNTIRVAIYTHREEIGIMKLVGASNWFVRLPFLVESVMYSLFATGIIVGIVYLSVLFTEPYLSSFFEGPIGLLNYFNANFVLIFVGQFIGMSIICILSTSMALGKYLKV
ncbi:MAG: permease-like cell division protein FtsX [Patescibacteria group bacterium]|nr:permease-like cell division protein FtsX [Patescibacteria group bacterium]